MKEINLLYFKYNGGYGNFGDELSKFITESLLNKKKYKLVCNQRNKDINIICIGSYIHTAKNNYYIFGSGVRTPNSIKNKKLNIYALRGPLSKRILESNGIKCPSVYGDPALLLPLFYRPKILPHLKDKIGIIPNFRQYQKIRKEVVHTEKYFLISPIDKWENVINSIFSCKAIISSSLHGLICADAYKKPNLWLNQYPLNEGDFKFKDYFLSQGREYISLKSLSNIKDMEKMFYKGGNKINLLLLKKNFPFL